jgi:ketosteroid isomerase-like protein
MKIRITLITAALALGAVSAFAVSPSEELARQANAWDKAIIHKDRAAISDNMAEDFRQISARGDVAGKAAFLDAIMSSKLVINPYDVEDMDIRFYGDVALVSGRTRMTGSYDGKPFGSHYRYIDVYVRKDGKWRVASVQITPVQE